MDCNPILQVVQQAHAVVLASGTLSPIASLTRQLFPTLPPSAITHFACGHVVPKDRLLALAVPQARHPNPPAPSLPQSSSPMHAHKQPCHNHPCSSLALLLCFAWLTWGSGNYLCVKALFGIIW